MQEMRKPRAGLLANGFVDNLGWPSLAVRRDNQPSCHFVYSQRSKIFANDVQTKINSGRATRRSKNVSFIDVEDIRLKPDCGKSAAQFLDISPMRRGVPIIQKSGGGQHEDSRADGN